MVVRVTFVARAWTSTWTWTLNDDQVKCETTAAMLM